jgi:hypothetical protein
MIVIVNSRSVMLTHTTIQFLRPDRHRVPSFSLSHGIAGTQIQQGRMKTLTCRLQARRDVPKASKPGGSRNYVTNNGFAWAREKVLCALSCIACI